VPFGVGAAGDLLGVAAGLTLLGIASALGVDAAGDRLGVAAGSSVA
jgi:hypothetical protein